MDSKGFKRGLVVLDMINKYLDPQGSCYLPNAVEILPFVEGEVSYFRERERPVIFCTTDPKQHYISKLSNENDYKPYLAAKLWEKDLCLVKSRPNAFYQTDLFAKLKDLGVGNLTIVGLMSHTSVLLTAASAIDLGFHVTVPQTCAASDNEDDHFHAMELIESWHKSEQMHR